MGNPCKNLHTLHMEGEIGGLLHMHPCLTAFLVVVVDPPATGGRSPPPPWSAAAMKNMGKWIDGRPIMLSLLPLMTGYRLGRLEGQRPPPWPIYEKRGRKEGGIGWMEEGDEVGGRSGLGNGESFNLNPTWVWVFSNSNQFSHDKREHLILY